MPAVYMTIKIDGCQRISDTPDPTAWSGWGRTKGERQEEGKAIPIIFARDLATAVSKPFYHGKRDTIGLIDFLALLRRFVLC
jgi:hypothetical protein